MSSRRSYWIGGVLAITLLSCGSNNKVEQPTKALLQVNLQNEANDYVAFLNGVSLDTIHLEAGKGEHWIDLNSAHYYQLKGTAFYADLFVKPGDTLVIDADASDYVNSASITGNSSEENTVLQALQVVKGEQQSAFVGLSNEEETAFADTLKAQLQAREALWANKELDADFVKMESLKKDLAEVAMWMKYNVYHPYMTKDTTYETSEAIKAKVASLDPNKKEYLSVLDAMATFSDAIDFKLQQEKEWEDYAAYQMAKFDLATSWITDDEVREKLNFYLLKNHIKYSGIDDVQANLTAFIDSSQNEEMKTELNELAAPWRLIAKGEMSTDLAMVNMAGESVNLSDFKGKYVYIDFWATWCGPCKAEIPFLESLQEEFVEENVAFVSISVDKTQEPWKKMVKEKDLKGFQLHAAESNTKIKEVYRVFSIPRFMILDPEGKIVDSNADRPSGDAKEVLYSLIKQKA